MKRTRLLVALIGGLLFATVSTLFFVPVVFATFHQRLAARKARGQGDDASTPTPASA